MEKKIRYQNGSGIWSDWMSFDDWITGIQDCPAIEICETMTKEQLQRAYPEVYERHFSEGKGNN